MKKNMTPHQIKKALKNKNISQSGLARDLNVTPQHIFHVIKTPTRSFSAACHIAKAIDKQLDDVWPEIYEPNQAPPKIGRPLTKGYFDLHPEAAG